MATKPEPIGTFQTPNWTAKTTPRETTELTVKVGDILVARLEMANQVGTDTATCEGGGLTWTLQKSFTGASNCPTWVWTAKATEAKSFKVKFTMSGTTEVDWGGDVQQWRGSSGIGAVAGVAGSTTMSQALTTTQAHSAIAMFGGDWEAKTGTATYRTGPGTYVSKVDVTVAGQYRVYGGYYEDVAEAKEQTCGMTAPTAQKLTFVLVEVKAGGTAWEKELADTVTVSDAIVKAPTKALADTASTTDAVVKAAAKTLADTAATSDAMVKFTAKPFADTQAVSDSLAKQARKALADAASVTDAVVKQPRKALADTQTTSDALAKSTSKVLADSQGVSDGLAKKAAKVLADTVSVSDSLSASRLLVKLLEDTVSVTDALVKGISKRLSDTASTSDSLAKKTGKSLGDTATVSDSLSRSFRKLLADTVSLADGILARIVRNEPPITEMPTTLELSDPSVGLEISGSTATLALADLAATLMVTDPGGALVLDGGLASLELADSRASLALDDQKTELELHG